MLRQERTRRDRSRTDASRHHVSYTAGRLCVLVLVALVFTAPIFATDPEEIDPEPNFAGQEIVVSDSADIASLDLPPGRYTVRILAADGSVEVLHLVVTP